MSRRAARRPRKSSCLYLSWAFPGWNKGGGGGLFLSLRLFSTLLLLVTCPPSLSLSLSPGRDGHSTASTKTIANFPFRAFYRVAIFSICHVSLYYRPVTRILLPPTFPLCPSLRFFFFFFFLYRYIADRSFHSLSARYQQGKDVLLLLRCTKRKSRFEEERFWFDKNVLISVVV